MNYQAIPRKYRPQTFEAIVGQQAVVTTLKNALKFHKTAHAYLFCGSRGTGKTTLARLFAKALNCPHLSEETEPCNACPSCVEITQGKSLDVLEIDGASNRGIDDIRQINETTHYTPSGKYKIYIIDEVHMLTKEAFNALLKTLEEPPANVKFFFATTEPHKVLPTIISRCQRFDLSRISPSLIALKLQEICKDLNVEIEEEALALIASLAEGGLRDAESILDQLISYADGVITAKTIQQTFGLPEKALFFALDKAIESRHLSYAFELAEIVFSSGKDFSCFLEGLTEHMRTHLLYKLKMPISHYISLSDKQIYAAHSAYYTEEQCLYMLDLLIEWQKNVEKLPFKRPLLENILLHLIRSGKRVSIPELTRRLLELESGKKAPPQIETEENRSFEIKSAPLKTEVSAPVVINPPPSPLEIKKEVLAEAAKPPFSSKESFAAPSTPEPVSAPSPLSKQKNIRHDTIARFAAVELEGTFKPR